MWPWFWWYTDEILVRYRQHFAHIWLIYNWISPNVTVRCDFVRGSNYLKNVYISNFPQFRSEGGGVSDIRFFQIKKKSTSSQRRRSRKLWNIFTFGDISFFLGGGAAPLYFHQNFLYPSCTLSITVPLVIPMVPLCSLHLASLSPNTSSPQLAGSALPFSWSLCSTVVSVMSSSFSCLGVRLVRAAKDVKRLDSSLEALSTTPGK